MPNKKPTISPEYLNDLTAQKNFKFLRDKSIFILDDDDSILTLVKGILGNDYVFDIRSFNDETEMIKVIAKEGEPSLLIVDYHLEFIKGDNVTNLLQDMCTCPPPVLFMSSDRNFIEVETAYSSKSSKIKKPFEKDDFREEVRKLLAA